MTAESYHGYNTGISSSVMDDVRTQNFPPDAHEQAPPPAYSAILGQVGNQGTDHETNATVGEDGRVNIRINERSQKLSALLVPALRHQRFLISEQKPRPPPYIPPTLGGSPGELPPPPMNVVIHVVGSRGDVQPFVALAKVLKETYGHRVRLATHPVFKDFVKENGIEFFSIGGNPSELMAFMVKNPGLLPGFDTLRNGDVGQRRKSIAEMLKGCWRSCIEAGDGTGIEASDDAIGDWMVDPDASQVDVVDNSFRPFVADAIIANPPSFAHIHCAERLGIPLHMMFTMPWSPTEAFPHPLANIESTNAAQTLSNYITYGLIDLLTWQGLGDLINRFRVHSLGLETINMFYAPGMLARLKVPWTYCWSPALIPKPADWGTNINISGFYFLNLANTYTPESELKAFLDSGPPPVYIGFGSIVVDDPNAMTEMIFDAVKITGQRALVSKGWGGLGADEMTVPRNVFMLGNVPHDWLFQRVSCIVHHGGAGTTAAGISAGKPTFIVPFFGDQPFWGSMVARAGAGPEPVRYKDLTAEILAKKITEALKPDMLERAGDLANKIAREKGCDKGAQSFHQMLDLDKMRCSILPEQAAVWRIRRTQVRLSALAAYVLAEKGLLSFGDLKLYRQREYEVDFGPTDPISGGAGAIVDNLTAVAMGVADFPIAVLKALAIHPDAHVKDGERESKEKKSNLKENLQADKAPVSTTLEAGLKSPGLPVSPEPSKVTSASAGPSGAMNIVSGVETPSTTPSTTLGAVTSDAGSSHSSEASKEANTANSAGIVQTTLADPAVDTGLLSPDSATRSSRSPTLNEGPQPKGSFMAEALRQLPESSRPRSRSGSRSRSNSDRRQGSDAKSGFKPIKDWLEDGTLDTVAGTGKGIKRIVGAGMKSPMDFTLGLSKGFHNLPRLYGEEVRQPDRVTDLKSGIRVAGKELGLGFWNGITGLVTQPISGAKKEGPSGFVKGMGRGLAGLVVKPGAGVYGLPGYAMKGIYKEIQKTFGKGVDNYIIAARTAQGWEAWLETDRNEQAEIVQRYLKLMEEVKRRKGEDGIDCVQDFIEQRKQVRLGDWARLKRGLGLNEKNLQSPGNDSNGEAITTHRGDRVSTLTADTHRDNLDQAIQHSIATSSMGDAAEDEAIGQAIRASIQHLNTQERANTDRSLQDSEEDEELRLAIAESLKLLPSHDRNQLGEAEELRRAATQLSAHEPGGSGLIKRFLAAPAVHGTASRGGSHGVADVRREHGDTHGGWEDDEVNRAIEESKRMDEDQEKARREEEIVLEHVKRQSLAEAEFRRRIDDHDAAGTN